MKFKARKSIEYQAVGSDKTTKYPKKFLTTSSPLNLVITKLTTFLGDLGLFLGFEEFQEFPIKGRYLDDKGKIRCRGERI